MLINNHWIEQAKNLRTALGTDWNHNTHTTEQLQVMAGKSFADMTLANFSAVLETLRTLERPAIAA